MAKVRVKPRLRPLAGATRRRRRVVSRTGAPGWPLAGKALAAAIVVAAAVGIPWLAPLFAEAFRFLGQGLVELLGLGLLPAALVIALAAWLALGRPLPASGQVWRRWLGLAFLLVAANGLLSLFRPGWQVGDVSLAETTAGGRFGHLLTDGLVGFVALAALVAAGLALAWPRGLVLLARRAWQAWRDFLSLRLPQRTWALARAVLLAFVPRGEGAAAADGLVDVINGEGTEEFTAPMDEGLEEIVDGTVVSAEPVPRRQGSPGEVSASAPGQGTSARPREQAATHTYRFPSGLGWEQPPVDLLRINGENGSRAGDNTARAQLIVDTLASFGVDARVAQINQGPAITQFGIEPGWEVKTRTVMERDAHGRPVYDKDGNPKYRTEVVSRTRVRVSQITALANDLALVLAAPSIRIEAPVPGKPIVGIEVPNTMLSLVTLRSVIESTPFQKITARSKLALALGKGVSGESVAADLAKMPHLLIAGATGSGKSVCINSLITCLLMHATPDEVRFILIDPKRVELTHFARIPHLAFSSIITNVEDVVGALQAVIHEMEGRYRRFAAVGVRNIDTYNRSPKAGRKLPYWVVVIDELADLMMAAPYEVERQLCRLAQLARATGIHLVVATQRPSVDVVTGLIKANFPTRIAFAVTSQVDSRTIIDGGGAEKLLGRGDMLYMPTDAAKPKRLQGVYISDQEMERVVEFWTSDRFRHLRPDTADYLLTEARTGAEAETDDDRLLRQARALTREHTRISTSLLQRRLRIGYPRAARLIDQLEKEGTVGPSDGGQSRRVVTSPEDRGEG
ncbi:MAG: DNA translocase FtsK [Dehalococcoidia bacterium]